MAPFFNTEKLFGWAFSRKEEQKNVEPVSFSPREGDDGAAVITASGAFGVFVDLDGSIRSEVELINRYRAMEQVAAVDIACDEIADEVIIGNRGDTVKLNLDDIEGQPDKIKKAIEDAFQEILDLLDFKNNGFQIFKRWYIDGRLYFHVIIDEKNTKDGIQELRYIDPRKIRKIREVIKRQLKLQQPSTNQTDAVVTQTHNEYFVYSDKGFNVGHQRPLQVSYPVTGVKIAKDSILHATSGLVDAAGTMTLSYLHKAIKPLNMYSTIKDQSLIYRLVRSPGRRVWYVDVGGLPTMKAEQYVRDVMVKHRNKLNYDVATGEIRDDRRFATMLEDFWLPVKDGKGTKVENLDGQANFSQMDDILFFQKELYQALHVPVNRISQDDQYSSPVATEITRDEIRFGKFISRLRRRFAMQLFVAALEKQLVLKQVMSLEDFKKIKYKLDFQFTKDNYFEEAKSNQVETMRAQLLQLLGPYVGRYYSNEWIRKNVLRQNDEDIRIMDEQIQEEESNPQYEGMPGQPPMEEGMDGEGEQDEGDGSGVIVAPDAMEQVPTNGTEAKADKPQPQKPNKKSPPDFKSVAKLLKK